jgi:shikimate dehydrogenase
MTRFIAVIGYPIGHSISPKFQQAALDHYNLDIIYEAREVEPVRLEQAMNILRQPSNLGANVTIPHKETIIPLLDELDDLARHIGAVNTIVNRNGRLCGYNTDAPAFIETLKQYKKFDPKDKRVVLLGAGGEGRAASSALVAHGVKKLDIFNRTFIRAKNLVSYLKEYIKQNDVELNALPWEESKLREALANCDLLVNCTSVGLKYSSTEGNSPIAAGLIPKGILAYDLEYNPLETQFLKEAKSAGADTLSGLSTLVYQGAASFKLWTEMDPPLDIMFSTAVDALALKQQVSSESKPVPVFTTSK